MGMGMALFPYVVLTVVALGVSLIDPIERALGSIVIGMPFPPVGTGYGVAAEATEPYSPFAPLTHPGTFLLVTSLVTGLVYRSRGYYRAAPEQEHGLGRALLLRPCRRRSRSSPSSVMAKVMDHSGQNEVLALGIAAVAPSYVYAFPRTRSAWSAPL